MCNSENNSKNDGGASGLIEQYLLRYLAGTIFAFFIVVYLVSMYHKDISQKYFQNEQVLSAYLKIILATGDANQTVGAPVAHEVDKTKEANCSTVGSKTTNAVEIAEVKNISLHGMVFILVVSFLYMHISTMPLLFIHSLRHLCNEKYPSMHEYHHNLALAREESKKSGDYVESYKKLRENGSSYASLLLELIFAFLLVLFNFNIYFILVWFMLGSLPWFFATYLERAMVTRYLSPDKDNSCHIR